MFQAMKSGQRRRDALRSAYRRAHGIHSLSRGTLLHLHGVPVTLRYDADLITAPANWVAIETMHSALLEADPPTWLQTRLVMGALGVFGLVASIFIWREPALQPFIGWSGTLMCIGVGFSVFAHQWARPDHCGR